MNSLVKLHNSIHLLFDFALFSGRLCNFWECILGESLLDISLSVCVDWLVERNLSNCTTYRILRHANLIVLSPK